MYIIETESSLSSICLISHLHVCNKNCLILFEKKNKIR